MNDNVITGFDSAVISEQEQELLLKCKSFPFVYNRLGNRWIRPLVYLFVALIVVSGIMVAVLFKNTALLPFVCVGAFILLLIIAIKERQVDMMKKLTQYFKDENGEFYRIVFTQGASIANPNTVYRRENERGNYAVYEKKMDVVERNLDEAQEIYPAFYYVSRFKKGIKDWDAMNGGAAKVTYLKNLAVISRGENKSTYTYEHNGKTKRLRILNDYCGLLEEVENK